MCSVQRRVQSARGYFVRIRARGAQYLRRFPRRPGFVVSDDSRRPARNLGELTMDVAWTRSLQSRLGGAVAKTMLGIREKRTGRRTEKVVSVAQKRRRRDMVRGRVRERVRQAESGRGSGSRGCSAVQCDAARRRCVGAGEIERVPREPSLGRVSKCVLSWLSRAQDE